MAMVAEKYASLVIVTEDNSRSESEAEIIKDILSGFLKTSRRRVITSRRAAIEQAILSAKENDIIVLVGKGHERYNVNENGTVPFDERQIIKDALLKRNKINEN